VAEPLPESPSLNFESKLPDLPLIEVAFKACRPLTYFRVSLKTIFFSKIVQRSNTFHVATL
jgi:hypothetical protein